MLSGDGYLDKNKAAKARCHGMALLALLAGSSMKQWQAFELLVFSEGRRDA